MFHYVTGKWRDTVCKKTVRHCVICHMSDPQQVFTLRQVSTQYGREVANINRLLCRGLCDESQIDRGYFLTNGDPEGVNISKMRPVYEGYFSKIDWFKAEHKDGVREAMRQGLIAHDNFAGFWRITSRLPQKVWRYLALTNMTNQVHLDPLVILGTGKNSKSVGVHISDRLPGGPSRVAGQGSQMRPI